MTLYLYNICDSSFLKKNASHTNGLGTQNIFDAEEFKSIAQINEFYIENAISLRDQLNSFIILQQVES